MPRQARLDTPGTLHHVMGGGIEGKRIRGGDRRRTVVGARKAFCRLAVKKLGYTGAATARLLGVITSWVNRYAHSEESIDMDKCL